MRFNNPPTLASIVAALGYTPVNKAGDTMTGALGITGGIVVVSTPLFNGTQTWNDGAVTFTGLKLNITSTASAAASLLADLQVAGVSQFKIDKSGNVTQLGVLVVPFGAAATSSIRFGTDTSTGIYGRGNIITFAMGGSAGFEISSASVVKISSGFAFGFSSGDATTALDSAFSRISAGIVGVGTGAAASVAGSLQATDLYTKNATYFLRTLIALTDSAGANVGTLTNAPSAGNPTKWISIDDNGTQRKVPAW